MGMVIMVWLRWLNDCLFEAIQMLFQNDSFLLENKVHEIAINHRIAIYLEQLLSNSILLTENQLSVDIEYNRELYEDIRSMEFECQNIWENEVTYWEEKNVRPDIVVHHRESNEHNILWIEVKLGEDIEICEFDKVKAYHACWQLNFQYAVAILIDYVNKRIVFQWAWGEEQVMKYEFELDKRLGWIICQEIIEEYKPLPILKYQILAK